ncbi:PSD1 and planctomycete cytochrome C domain-containing protein [Maioricimonas sp. JC845]|uniref:PSD1 and planctomycete cytochrome C domain-containing protein n=1 Tax=Maioricimonas sp. JC845 TaxID=3232138 RepID=UPI003459505A
MTLCAIAATIAAGTTQLLATAPGPAAANSSSPVAEAGSEDLFTKAVAPLLESRCVECHNSEDASGGLNLQTRTGAMTGGDSGPAIVPADPDSGTLMYHVAGSDADMPASGDPLTTEQIDALASWIRQGAPWPESSPLEATGRSTRPSGTWWAFEPLRRPDVPDVPPEYAHWVRTPIDAFILHRQLEAGVAPAPVADDRTLLRRLYYDLTGLPPTFQEIEDFSNDPAEDAYERLVDRLLASPHYGERWARHWLDVAHYADTNGYGSNHIRKNAWPYRDYVIRSLNDDKTYTRFVEEQIAGDCLYPDSSDAVIACGFLVAGPWDEAGHCNANAGSLTQQTTQYNDRDDIITNVMTTFTSLTVHCARCHDHKFDPISQEDYYCLQAVFAGIDRTDRAIDGNIRYGPNARWWLVPALASLTTLLVLGSVVGTAVVLRMTTRIRLLCCTATGLAVVASAGMWTIWITDYHDLPLRVERRIERKFPGMAPIRFDARFASAAKVFGPSSSFPPNRSFHPPEGGKPRTVNFLARGSISQPEREVGPGTVSCIPDLPSRFTQVDIDDEGARRIALAEWIVDRRNPLTWRSIVNRVWQYHFGRGLVNSPNDFGQMGMVPTHPELLDWLAVEFRDNGQSLKDLHRLIVNSAVYRQGLPAAGGPTLEQSRQLYCGAIPQRLEAEAIRDSILFVSGRLDLQMYGPGFRTFTLADIPLVSIYHYADNPDEDPQTCRRAVYQLQVRADTEPLMSLLDCPDGTQSVAVRDETLTGLQALAMMNSPLVVGEARHFAERVARLASDTPSQLNMAFQLALGRLPSPEERELLQPYAGRHGIANVCRMLLNTNEFLFID